jgi:hypothetical protein
MISIKLINYFKARGWWYDETMPEYELALTKIGISKDSDFGDFYLHADAGPSFISKVGEIHQILWHVNNTNYVKNAEKLAKALGIEEKILPLDAFTGGGGYIFIPSNGGVFLVEAGRNITELRDGKLAPNWASFGDFLDSAFLENR